MIDVTIKFRSFEDAGRAMLAIAGSAPDAEAAFAPQAASEPAAPEAAAVDDKPKRTRRTKSEMEAARAADETATEQPTGEGETSDTEGKPMSAAEAENWTKIPGQAEAEPEKELTKEEAETKFKNEVRPALQAVIAKLGQDEARTTLTSFKDLGIQKLSDIPIAEYDDFIAACKAKVA